MFFLLTFTLVYQKQRFKKSCQQKRKIAVVEAKKEKPIKKMKERENQCLFERKSPKRKK